LASTFGFFFYGGVFLSALPLALTSHNFVSTLKKLQNMLLIAESFT
jgi:hypothetical protein